MLFWNYHSLLFKLFYKLSATLKCLFLTSQDFLQSKNMTFRSEGKLKQATAWLTCL